MARRWRWAFDLSVRLGFCPAEAAGRVRRHLAAAGLPTELPQLAQVDLSAETLLALMQKDKKVRDGRVTLILARDIGEAFICREVTPATLGQFLAAAARRNVLEAAPPSS